ncbi:helix-turn-helix transcriptional regulator [Otoolea muris]|uniref:helix-turn-helix transcriptional regulator n=1 Tax=Otoolea muris TaxID=2941515 RepID=UPI00203DD494|nr:helix-turn-helix transcriptional regulator [Otoolea muris]
MKKTTGELLELLKRSPNASSYINGASDDLIQPVPLSDYLARLILERHMKKSSLIRPSGLDRGYVYDILAGKKNPSRDKVLAICFAFPLSDAETQQLLKATGYAPLYARLGRDSVILFALQHSLSLIEANNLLYDMNYPILE